MKVITSILVTLLTLLAVESARAQFGKMFSATNFVPTTVNRAYHYGTGQLFALLETTPSNDEAYVFANKATGELQGALRLDAKHGALTSPDGREILIAGAQTTNGQPVYFAGRYNATNLAPIGQMQINVNASSGYNLSGEVSPDGNFIYRGNSSLLNANIVAKYGTNFAPAWGATLKHNGGFDLTGPETYPLANGDIGFLMRLGAGTPYTNVLGLLNGTNGLLKWSAVVTNTPTTPALMVEDFRFIFGPDGSLFGSLNIYPLLSGNTNAVRLARLNPNGTLAYSKTLTVTNATYNWHYYLGGKALVSFTFQDGSSNRLQFIVLDENGNLTGNTALNCGLGGGGTIKYTAARREGTDFAFARWQATLSSMSPQQTLARINLTNGAIDLRQLPAPAPGVETYEVVTTPKGDYLSPHNNSAGIAAVTTALVGNTDKAGGGGTVGFYELPANGDLPACPQLNLSDNSAVALVTPRGAQLANVSFINLAAGATLGTNAMPGMTTPLALPVIQSLVVTNTTVCPDDGSTATGPTLKIVRTPPTQATISWTPPTPGFKLQERTNLTSGSWSNSPSGSTNPITVPATLLKKFYRLSN